MIKNSNFKGVRTMKKYSAFTLIELLIVVAIIAILAAIAVPNFLEAQTRSKVSRAQADMRSLATAIESYRVDNNSYPAAITGDVYWYMTYDSNRTVKHSPATITNANYGACNESNRWCVEGVQWTATFLLAKDGSIASITTPIAYITSYPRDPFADTDGLSFGYTNMDNKMWILWSFGPDQDELGDDNNGGQVGNGNGINDPLKVSAKCYKDRDLDDSWARPWNNAGKTIIGPEATHPSATLLTAGYTYDSTNGTKSKGDLWRLKQ
jgi:prepilin-type N-terminal cleavage/methylation domain-containing protein